MTKYPWSSRDYLIDGDGNEKEILNQQWTDESIDRWRRHFASPISDDNTGWVVVVDQPTVVVMMHVGESGTLLGKEGVFRICVAVRAE